MVDYAEEAERRVDAQNARNAARLEAHYSLTNPVAARNLQLREQFLKSVVLGRSASRKAR